MVIPVTCDEMKLEKKLKQNCRDTTNVGYFLSPSIISSNTCWSIYELN